MGGFIPKTHPPYPGKIVVTLNLGSGDIHLSMCNMKKKTDISDTQKFLNTFQHLDNVSAWQYHSETEREVRWELYTYDEKSGGATSPAKTHLLN